VVFFTVKNTQINFSVRQKAQLTDDRTQPVVITERLRDDQNALDRHSERGKYRNIIPFAIASHRVVHPPALGTIPMYRGRFVLGVSHFTPGTPAGKQGVRVQKL
jgi:hypothetical protein